VGRSLRISMGIEAPVHDEYAVLSTPCRMSPESRGADHSGDHKTIEYFRQHFGAGFFKALEHIHDLVVANPPGKRRDLYR
jgi:hypothetical protein